MTRKITQVASEDAGDRGAWLKGSREDFPHLPLPPNQFFKDPIAVKSYAAKQLKWLLKPLNLKRGEGQFPGWDFLINKASLFYTGSLLANLPSESFSLSMLIEWLDMADMASVSSGNVKTMSRRRQA